MQYPSGWHLSEDGLHDLTGKESATPFIAIGNPLGDPQAYVLYIFIEDNADRLSPRAYAVKMIQIEDVEVKQSAVGGLSFSSQYDVAVGPYRGYELYDVFDYDESLERVYLMNGSRAYRIDFPVAEDNQFLFNPKENNPVAHQILPTFKFTEPTM